MTKSATTRDRPYKHTHKQTTDTHKRAHTHTGDVPALVLVCGAGVPVGVAAALVLFVVAVASWMSFPADKQTNVECDRPVSMDQQPSLTDAHRVPRANPRHRNDRVFTENDILLAWRNVGMPMESLVCDTTPPGLHYTLHHFDIPFLDGAHTCQITGLCSESVLTLESLKQMANEGAKREIMVTLECAGNGRSGMNPRPAQNVPWQIHGAAAALSEARSATSNTNT